MIYSVMALLYDKKKQVSAVLLVRSEVGRMYAFPFLALSESRLKKIHTDTSKWGVLDLPSKEEDEAAKDYFDNCISTAREKSTPVIIATSLALEALGVNVQPFGKGWPDDWEQIGEQVYKTKGCEIHGVALPWMLDHSKDDDLTKCFYAAWYLAARFNFFAVTAEDAQAAMLHDGGARPLQAGEDVRAGLKLWRQNS
jgi:hypothetical protein